MQDHTRYYKMKKDKKPDNVVFNTTTQKYDAALKPYATNVGAPVITTTDTIAWKNRSINKINHKVAAKYLELKDEYDKMLQEFEYNKLIFQAKLAKYIIYTKEKTEPLFFPLLIQANVTLIGLVVFI